MNQDFQQSINQMNTQVNNNFEPINNMSKKKNIGLIIGIAVIAIVIVVIFLLVFKNKGNFNLDGDFILGNVVYDVDDLFNQLGKNGWETNDDLNELIEPGFGSAITFNNIDYPLATINVIYTNNNSYDTKCSETNVDAIFISLDKNLKFKLEDSEDLSQKTIDEIQKIYKPDEASDNELRYNGNDSSKIKILELQFNNEEKRLTDIRILYE